MDNRIGAVFFDVDGTLVDHGFGSKIPPSTMQSLEAMQKKGIKVFVATGRSAFMIDEIKKLFPFDGFVTCNGQNVFDKDGNVIRLAHIDPEDIKALVEIAKREQLPCDILEADRDIPVLDTKESRMIMEWLHVEMPELYDISRLEEHPAVQALLITELERGRELLKDIPGITVTSAGSNLLDLIPSSGGKHVGIEAAGKYYGLKRENIMSFGDGINDASMIEWAGIGVAMGNAPDEVKNIADYVTTSVSDNGVKNALIHFNVLSEDDFN